MNPNIGDQNRSPMHTRIRSRQELTWHRLSPMPSHHRFVHAERRGRRILMRFCYLAFPWGRIRSDGDLPSSGTDPAGSPKTQIARKCAAGLVACIGCQVAASPINPPRSPNRRSARAIAYIRYSHVKIRPHYSILQHFA
jgi:hypothetical protein